MSEYSIVTYSQDSGQQSFCSNHCPVQKEASLGGVGTGLILGINKYLEGHLGVHVRLAKHTNICFSARARTSSATVFGQGLLHQM